MKIKCVKEKVLFNTNNQKLVKWVRNSELEITIDKVYIVLAISKYLDSIFYYVIGDETDNYPLAFPSELFEIIDDSVSKYWDIDLVKIKSLQDINIENGDVISFKEWSLKKDRFYECILEEMKYELAIFNNYKDKMLNE